MTYCGFVVEVAGKHRDWKTSAQLARCVAYEKETLECMKEMERIKPGINAEAEAFRLNLPEPPRTRPPPVASATAGLATAATTTAAAAAAMATITPPGRAF